MLVRFLFLPLGLAALPWAGRAPECQPIALFASLVVACGVAIALTVGTCWFAVARYQLDFWPPIALAAALGLGLLAGAATRLWQRAALASVAARGVRRAAPRHVGQRRRVPRALARALRAARGQPVAVQPRRVSATDGLLSPSLQRPRRP